MSIVASGEGRPMEYVTAPAPLPDHIRETVDSITALHDDHRAGASYAQKVVAAMTAAVGRPSFIGLLTVALIAWVGLNLWAPMAGWRPIDAPPFVWLELSLSLAALYLVILILVTQRRDDMLSQHREKLILELVAASDQKTAKMIELLEEFRVDNPQVRDRVDTEADDMAQRTKPESVLEAIKDSEGAD